MCAIKGGGGNYSGHWIMWKQIKNESMFMKITKYNAMQFI